MNWTVLVINLAVAAPAAYWTYQDAKGRDANSVLWAATIILAGLFFLGPLGPLGTAIVLLIYGLADLKVQ